MYTTAAAAAKSLQSCPTLRPHRLQPTRLSRPWDSPGKNTGVGRHFLFQCVKVKVKSCPTLSNPMDCSPSGSSVRGIFQARLLESGAIASGYMCFNLLPGVPGGCSPGGDARLCSPAAGPPCQPCNFNSKVLLRVFSY